MLSPSEYHGLFSATEDFSIPTLAEMHGECAQNECLHLPATANAILRRPLALSRRAHDSLSKNVDRIAGQLIDRLADSSANDKIRRRLPRILAGSKNRLAWDGLFRQLGDERFEIRLRCGRALEKIQQTNPAYRPLPADVFEVNSGIRM